MTIIRVKCRNVHTKHWTSLSTLSIFDNFHGKRDQCISWFGTWPSWNWI